MLAYVWTFGFTYPQYPNIINRLIKQHSNESESVFLTGYHDSITLTILAIQVFYFMFSYSLSIIALLRIFQYYQEYQNLYLYFL